jgi:Protein of unknown function (DUF1501)
MQRRTFLKALLLAGMPMRVLADSASPAGEFFVFIHASGGWDVTLWADPRNEKKGIIHPAATDNTDPSQVRHWVDAPMEDGTRTFQLVKAKSGAVFGPGIGDLLDLSDRITVVNGLAMNTVSHPDGSSFSATGRHLVGGRAPAPSIDTMVANELGREQLFPVVSVAFPSAYVGDGLDRRVVPLTVGQIGSVSRSLARAEIYDTDADRDEVTALLSQEANDLAARSAYPDVMRGVGLQMDSLRRMLGSKLSDAFSGDALKKAHPQFNYKGRFHGGNSVNAAFAVEAMKRNVVRCVSFSLGGFDTHGTNYRTHAQLLQETMDLVAILMKSFDETPHPTLAGKKLSDHTHLVMVSDFCRTPQINQQGGRDHYPNNSALVVSPRFKGGLVFGKSDPEQLLPAKSKKFIDGDRAIAPPDLLATFLSSFKVNPRKYMRDGEIVPELLKA